MNSLQKIDGGFSLESPNGCITYPSSCSSFLVEFGNVALRFTRDELNDFIEFLDGVSLPSHCDCGEADERTIVIETPERGTILLFNAREFDELYGLLVDTQINMVLQEKE